MKNIFDSKDEKITEKAFVQSVVISVVGILLCIVALCSATFCWFTGETESNSNTLVSGTFGLDVSVTGPAANTDGADAENAETAGAAQEAVAIDVTPDAEQEGVWVCRMTEVGTYTVTLTLKEGSTVKGHCLVSVGNAEAKHTDAIIGEQTANSEGLTKTNPFTFTVTVTQEQITNANGAITVRFEPRWGVVVKPDIVNGGVFEDATDPSQSE